MVTFYRRLPKFDFVAPRSLDEALSLLARYEGKAKVIAGGTDVIPKLKRRQIGDIDCIIDLKAIPGLDYIRYDNVGGLSIGPLATIRSVERSMLIRERFPILSQAAESMASPQVRNRGTVAGNICNAVPSADMAPALLALEANVTLVSQKGSRTVNIEDFFVGPNQTVLARDELLNEIRIQNLPPSYSGKYLKLMPRRAMDLAIVGVAVLVSRENGICRDIRIALGAVSPTPVRARGAESIIKGKSLSDDLVDRVSQAAAMECSPISDHRASAEYRVEMVKVLTRRAIRHLTFGEAILA